MQTGHRYSQLMCCRSNGYPFVPFSQTVIKGTYLREFKLALKEMWLCLIEPTRPKNVLVYKLATHNSICVSFEGGYRRVGVVVP